MYKCDNCNSKVIKYKPEITPREKSSGMDERYKLPLNMANNQNSPKISMTEPIFLNSNSYENITSIIDTLKISLQIGVKREWSFRGRDGPPYVIASRLIDEDNDWVARSNGLGHLYMNQMKTFLNIARDITMEPLAKDVLHFESPTAIQHFFKCSDTHKTYINH